ncbi:MAG: ABC transporter permease subunit [Clostridiales bacterium]|nr:ABC transporter permease subunit [Clostridiales bacterium]
MNILSIGVLDFFVQEAVGFKRLLRAFCVNLYISLVSVLLSIFFGILFGFIVSKRKIFRIVFKIFLEIVRIIPIFAWLFLFYFKLSGKNGGLSGTAVSIIVFFVWGTFEFSDIILSSMEALPKHQYESGLAIGFTYKQLYKKIIMPQIMRMVLPNAINLIVRMIKTTSIVTLIGVIEVLKVGQQIIEYNVFKNPKAPFFVYGFIFALFFVACQTVSCFAKFFENKFKI